MIQVARFSTGGFVSHRMTLHGSRCKFSGWFRADGTLEAAARYDSLNREYEPGRLQREAIAKLGKIWRNAQ